MSATEASVHRWGRGVLTRRVCCVANFSSPEDSTSYPQSSWVPFSAYIGQNRFSLSYNQDPCLRELQAGLAGKELDLKGNGLHSGLVGAEGGDNSACGMWKQDSHREQWALSCSAATQLGLVSIFHAAQREWFVTQSHASVNTLLLGLSYILFSVRRLTLSRQLWFLKRACAIIVLATLVTSKDRLWVVPRTGHSSAPWFPPSSRMLVSKCL